VLASIRIAPAETSTDIAALARDLRATALRMVHRARASHIGSCLSSADLLAVLYGGDLRVDPARPDWPDRDRFILSKGHAAAVLYAALAARGFFPREWLDDYCAPGSPLLGHVTKGVPGVELSTGSLGHGLPVGCGMALAAKRGGGSHRIVVLLSDGEMDEGSNWEAALFAAHHRLDRVVAIVDANGIQSFGAVKEVLDLEPLADKWRAFRWNVLEIDGHDRSAIHGALRAAAVHRDGPTVIVARTVKGKGVSFMEGELAWHYRSPSDEQLRRALAEVEAAP
jgi:transketolase